MRVILILFALFRVVPALAACTGEGSLNWNTGSGAITWCNGISWVNSTVAVGISCSGEPTGKVSFISGDLRYCDGTFWRSMKGVSIDSCSALDIGKFNYDASRKLWKFCDGFTWNAMYVAGAPSMGSILANDGNNFTNRNAISMDLTASVSDGGSVITHVCLKYSTTGSPPSTPGVNDTCWIPVTLLGGVPGSSINLSNFFFSVAFAPANYSIFSWIKTGANQISSLSNSGSGTASQDFDAITFSPGQPPVLIDVFATNSDSPSIPPVAANLMLTPGQDVYVKWHLSDDEALPGAPIEVSYTTDEVNFTTIATNLVNGANGSCTVTPGTHTGCYRWVSGAPASTYFKVRVKALDAAGLSTITGAEPNNMSPFKVIAGNQDPGSGSSAASAVIFPVNKNHATETGAGNFIVRDNGTFYLAEERALMMVDPDDGNYKVFLRYTGVATDGALSSATLRHRPWKMALDYQDRLLIFDYDRIRRVDFTTNTITTIIGGGGSTSEGTDALSFAIDPPGGRPPALLFAVLPNGNIWFQNNNEYQQTPANTRIRIYRASDNKVYSWTPSGTGSLEDPAFNPSGHAIYNIGIEFNAITSAVTRVRSRSSVPYTGGHTPYSVSYDPTTGVTTTPHVPYVSYWSDDNTINSRSGEMYSVERFTTPGLYKYNPGTNTWTRIIGNGSKGQCPDGTVVTACGTDITDAYVNSQNQIFIVDKGRIRTVDSDNKMVTIFGQALTYGDGGLAVSARLNDVLFIDLTNSGKIALADSAEHVLREFTPDGNMIRLAGNGNDATADTTNPANTQAISTGYWGGPYPMVADSSTGDVFFTRTGTTLSRLSRSTGRWVDIAGGGGTSYASADGLTGNNIALDGYNHGALGFNGSQVLYHTQKWDGTSHPDVMIKSYAVSDGTQSSLVGKPLVYYQDNLDACTDGTPLNDCAFVPNFHANMTRAIWDGANARWLLLQKETSRIRTAAAGGNWGTLVTLPRGIQGFTYTIKATIPHVYYCASGRVYRYNLNTSTETILPWPSSSITCHGHSLVWHPTRQTIIFPIKQNGLGGVAEIYDP